MLICAATSYAQVITLLSPNLLKTPPKQPGKYGKVLGSLPQAGQRQAPSGHHRLVGDGVLFLLLSDGVSSMETPRGMGRGKGNGLYMKELAIMAMENVWFICVLVAASIAVESCGAAVRSGGRGADRCVDRDCC